MRAPRRTENIRRCRLAPGKMKAVLRPPMSRLWKWESSDASQNVTDRFAHFRPGSGFFVSSRFREPGPAPVPFPLSQAASKLSPGKSANPAKSCGVPIRSTLRGPRGHEVVLFVKSRSPATAPVNSPARGLRSRASPHPGAPLHGRLMARSAGRRTLFSPRLLTVQEAALSRRAMGVQLPSRRPISRGLVV